ncbi:MAG: putative lipid II flippase FtsW [Acidobacteria bacterium]|jgi:cell division protein FtsW|nr:MAG: putative lipid II flippase FtsW [Acidobacteriota bacterium]GIU82924.1 MAG: stage V sporulation protein E [Pyrinomonadaceae bacterium]
MAKKLRVDWFLFAIATTLALFGAVMVYSASAMISLQETKNSTQGPTEYAYFYKQSVFALVGILLMWFFTKFDYHVLQKKAVVYGFLALTIVLLCLVFLFPPVNGAQRWIRFGGFSFQPSELAKLALPIFLASFLADREEKMHSLKESLLPCLLVLAVLCGLIFVEPDLGTTMVLCAIFFVVYFSAGAKIWHLVLIILPILGFLVTALIFSPWRLRRLTAFLDPCAPENASGAGYQVCQSLYAIGSGGVFGEGFAKGQQKLFYLPYPYSDFIFAVIGEELGLIGTMALVFVFGLFLWRASRAAMSAPDRFGMLLGIGIVTGIIFQVLFNLSVAISILPAKGIPLPFISYGGSSIITTLLGVGILLNLSQYAGFVHVEEPKPIKPIRRRIRKVKA